jgi:pimeloyl-ACP methyl ester carboxylesterase
VSRFILVPGGNHGGWWFEPLVLALEKAGHNADAITLSGLAPEGPAAPGANLDAHVAEVAALCNSTSEPLVLVGHSYAGSVISGAGDQIPERIKALVYLDAFVPENGDSCWSMTSDWEREWFIDGCGSSGTLVAPLPFFDKRARPHPIGTYLQKSRLTGAWKKIKRKHFVAAVDPEWLKISPFVELTQRLRRDPAWAVTELPCTHNFLAHGPDLLLPLLLAEG